MVKFYDFILTLLKPIVVFTGKIYMPFSRKRITGADYYKWRDDIKVGMVLLTKTRGEFSNLINPMKIKHAGIYVGNLGSGEVYYVLEAVGKGVVLTDLVSFLTSKDLVVGCMPNFIRDEASFNYQIHEEARRIDGLPYDYLFKKDGKAFYCFEAAASCLKGVYSELQLKCREIVNGKKVYDFNTFLDPEYFDVIFDSRNRK